MKLNDSNSATARDREEEEEEKALRKKEVLTSLYGYSDLSIKNIALELDISANEVQQITDELPKTMRLFQKESTTKIEKNNVY